MRFVLAVILIFSANRSLAGTAIPLGCEIKDMKSCPKGGHATYVSCGDYYKGWVSYYWVSNGVIQKGKDKWGTEDGSCNGPCLSINKSSCSLEKNDMSLKFNAAVNEYMFTKDFSEKINCPTAPTTNPSTADGAAR